MDYKKYCQNQADAAKCYKRIKDKEVGEDLGEQAIVEWVDKYAKEYREDYEKAYDTIIKRVMAKAQRIIKEKLPNIGELELEIMAKVVVDQFTDIWTIEMTDDNHDKHIEEI